MVGFPAELENVGVRVARCASVCVSSISLLTNTTTEKGKQKRTKTTLTI